MSTILQISDPHFGTEQPVVVAALLRLNRELVPDAVIVSGDITQRARRTQFEAARQFVQALEAKRLLTIPGNHDIPLFNLWARWQHPYRNYSRAFGIDLEPAWESDDALILCVNTTRPHRHKDGEVSSEQIERVSGRLRQAKTNQVRVVVTHQPVQVASESDIHNLLHGRGAAVPAWSAAGVDLILGGHIHLAHVRLLSDQYPKISRRAWSIQAGTAVSSRTRGGLSNSVNVLRLQTLVSVVERWDYDASSETFQLRSSNRVEIDRDS